MAEKRDWPAIKLEYVAGDMSLAELGAKHGIAKSTLWHHAGNEGWAEARRAYRGKVEAKAQDALCARDAKRLEKLMGTVERLAEVTAAILEDEKQFRRWLVTTGGGDRPVETKERVFSKYDTKSIKNMTGSLKDLVEMMKDYYAEGKDESEGVEVVFERAEEGWHE